jgi:S1-C subfamily serine protease
VAIWPAILTPSLTAVLKIIPEGKPKVTPPLPVAELGDSDRLQVGQIVIAVGSPGGLDNTVTMGIVSGLGRSSTIVGIPHKKVDYVQTDAAINPGNSGGPLCDVETGQVVGINAALRAHMEGTSFAIPINRVRDIMHDLADGKEIQHGYLGISLTTCTPERARKNNAMPNTQSLPEVYGALVHKVFPRTPADKGGIRSNDVITKVNGATILSGEDARKLIDAAKVGEVSTCGPMYPFVADHF